MENENCKMPASTFYTFHFPFLIFHCREPKNTSI